MLPYGLNYVEYEEDSKRSGDLFGFFPAHSRRGVCTVKTFNRPCFIATMRRYKKKARQTAKREIVERMGE